MLFEIGQRLSERMNIGTGRREPIGAPESVGPSTVDRVSATEKGSLLIWSNVELR